MTTRPRGELDPRFGDPDATATDWTVVTRALADAPLFWITTVRPDSRPHVTPLVAVWVDDELHFCTGADERKNLNLDAHREVVLTTGSNQWDQGLDIVVEGTAVRATDERRLRRLADAWGRKWDGRWQFEVNDGTFGVAGSDNAPLVYTVTTSKIIAFGKNPFSQTSYRF